MIYTKTDQREQSRPEEIQILDRIIRTTIEKSKPYFQSQKAYIHTINRIAHRPKLPVVYVHSFYKCTCPHRVYSLLPANQSHLTSFIVCQSSFVPGLECAYLKRLSSQNGPDTLHFPKVSLQVSFNNILHAIPQYLVRPCTQVLLMISKVLQTFRFHSYPGADNKLREKSITAVQNIEAAMLLGQRPPVNISRVRFIHLLA